VLSNKPPNYCSYVLRCWLEATPHAGEEAIIHYSLEDPHTGERFMFAGVASMADFLRAQVSKGGDGSTSSAKHQAHE